MTENALSILSVIFSVQLQQTEISERKLFIFHLGIGAQCRDVGARCGDVCVWGSDVDDRAEVIRSDDIGAQCGNVGARHGDVADSVESRYRVAGDTGDCGVGITPQMCNRVTNHGDMSTFSKSGLTEPFTKGRPIG